MRFRDALKYKYEMLKPVSLSGTGQPFTNSFLYMLNPLLKRFGLGFVCQKTTEFNQRLLTVNIMLGFKIEELEQKGVKTISLKELKKYVVV